MRKNATGAGSNVIVSKGCLTYFPIAVLVLAGALMPPAPCFSQTPGLSIDGYSLVESKRISRVVFEYTYRASVKNNSQSLAEDVTGSVSSDTNTIKIIDPYIVVGNIDAGVSKESSDVFTIQVDRRYRFSRSSLKWELHTSPSLVDVDPASTDVLNIVRDIPQNATTEQLSEHLDNLLAAVSSISRRDIGILREAISDLKNQPNIITALRNYYESLEINAYDQRRVVLGVTGELQTPDALNFLLAVVSNPLPTSAPAYLAITEREQEEKIQIKAVHGIGFIRNSDDKPNVEADKQLILVMLNHESDAVRIAAINTFMWNHGDTPDAAAILFQAIPPDFHKYVQMPRFYAGVNRSTFEEQLRNWESQWAQ